ncbi:hypothetical protein CANARDRAFT_9028 [[Candida] arabinofermentans NRRL YB-2248]|uniref:Importin N-terminal domain-containing protein n=1 Tax=[Candida] arabinofermentans NRRL YB-2248 TaxID=983967 RepID=A0A1E4SWZ9_9ASCO|nr:hypothetical protein CANARDRAFT_9028 [[Candida] arabinofermentans NRRL YB-2248]
MSDIQSVAQVLEQSLLPATAKQAELTLRNVELQQGFPSTLLHVIATDSLSSSIRLAGSLYFKNLIKRKWIDETGSYKLHLEDVKVIKAEIVGLMIQLPDSLQVQIGESISLIAESEFPELWPELLDELVNKLSLDNMESNKGVLKVAHSIFKRWRPLFRSDELFTEIALVLSKFAEPFLELFKRVDDLIDQNSNDKNALSVLFDNLLLLVKIYFDLNCQDIPEFFEDHMQEGLGIIHKYLKYSNPLLEDPSEEEETDIVTLVKTSSCELIQLYITRYQEELGTLVQTLVETVWGLLDNVGLQPKYDILVSKALQFLTVVASSFPTMFNSREALEQITQKILLPNVTLRETDEELFEDDPIEFTRRDLEGSDSDTRRRATTDFLRALKEENEQVVTNVVMGYITHYMAQYQQDSSNWKAKDLAIYLFSSIASKGSITNAGITSTNLLVDVVEFFSNYIASDLVNQVSHPILKVDAIKYIFTFRNQLTKQQLLETFPLLSAHFQDDNYVVYTYTAITTEKILSLRNPTNHAELLFSKKDIPAQVSQDLLMNLFRLMFKKGDTPEKLAENEFLMKCIMRIILTSEDSLSDFNVQLLQQLIKIVELIGKNPSNPKFTHYTFESICVLIKFNAGSIVQILDVLKPSMLSILGLDIQEFIPYSFQILAYCLEIYPKSSPLPQEFEQLIKPLCSPSIWESKGNVPAIVRLLSAIIKFKPELFITAESLTPILGVFQKLISSKLQDHLGFDFMETILLNIPLQVLQPFLKEIAMIMLTRLQTSKTERYVKRFVVFLCFICCLPASSDASLKKNVELNSSFVIQLFENVQPGLFVQVLTNFIIPTTSKLNNLLDKKILVVGLTSLLTENQTSLPQDKMSALFVSLLHVITSDSIKDYKNFNENAEILLELDNDDIGFGNSFNKLNIIQLKPLDPAKEINSKSLIMEYFRSKVSAMTGLQNIAYGLSEEDRAALKELRL